MKQLTWIDKGFVGACLFLCLLTMILNWNSPVARSLLRGERIAGLLIGSDYDDRARHSDTLMYVSYDPQNRFLDVLSIPRDTEVNIPKLPSVRRINEVFTYEFRHSGRDFNIASMALKGYVETLLSSGAAQGIQIPYYVTIHYKAFRDLIDSLGGIYVRVTEPMHYDDNWGGLHIHFDPGTHLMTGKMALEYVRYRGGATADQGRVLRQQIFIKDVIQRLKSPVFLWSFPKHAKLVLDNIYTNFSLWDWVSILLEGRRMHLKDLRLASVPGVPHGVLWKMNSAMTQDVLTMMQEPASQTAKPVQKPAALGAEQVNMVPTVEVWNASGHSQVAKQVVQLLRDKGFDVVVFGNFAAHQQRTIVIDRSGHLRPAQGVADVLRVVHPEVVSRIDLSRQVDVSVILGVDAAISNGKKRSWR